MLVRAGEAARVVSLNRTTGVAVTKAMATILDPAGFTWDLGGHVVFSHFGEFDRLLDDAIGD